MGETSEPALVKGVVVTGAAQGIGKAIRARLLASGWHVVGLDIEEGPQPWVVGDASEPEPHEAAIRLCQEAAPLAAYINNAGIIHRTSILDTEPEVMDRVIAVNLRGSFLGLRAAAKAFIAQGGPGHIVFLSSGHSVLAGFDRAVYAATKAGVEALARNAANELGHMGIVVNAVAPGFTFTEMSRGSLVGQRLQFVEKRLPLGRVGEADEAASAVEAIITDRLSGMTGQVVRIDGGWSNSDIRYVDWKPVDS